MGRTASHCRLSQTEEGCPGISSLFPPRVGLNCYIKHFHSLVQDHFLKLVKQNPLLPLPAHGNASFSSSQEETDMPAARIAAGSQRGAALPARLLRQLHTREPNRQLHSTGRGKAGSPALKPAVKPHGGWSWERKGAINRWRIT